MFTSLRGSGSVVFVGLALAVAFGACTRNVRIEGDGDCVYNGETHDAGDTFPAGDNCNECSCESDGEVLCTQIDCTDPCDGEVPIECDSADPNCYWTGPFCDESGWTCGDL